MVNIHGIHLKREIYSSNHSRVFEGIEQDSGKQVIVKILQDSENKSNENVNKFLMEFQILKKFDHPGIIKPISIEDSRKNPTLILEHGGTSLRTLQFERKFSHQELSSIFLQTAEILGEIHSKNIIHKDINPGNIVYDPITGRVKIIDFGISSILSREKENLKNPNVIEGTLAYISPEQTGRMNRIIDYRTDFYSLGITIFELFTGNLPFYSKDSMELIHQHLSFPIPVIQGDVPEFIVRIIQRLMAKNAEDRYQSAFGLKTDLESCLALFKENSDTSTFILGKKDTTPDLIIPEKLYGRETEINSIMEIFESASKGPVEVILVSGYSGTGKSALVRELYKPITKQNGYFLSGKFDQLQKDIPYSALVHAFRELVAQIMTEPGERIQYWKDTFLKALSPNAGVVLDVIPELEEILGTQPPVPHLEPKEAQNRFNLYFDRFIRVLLRKDHPLVIFLDDLQWADGASLRFIQNLLLGHGLEHLLFIGAYRENEVYAGHPSMVMLSELEKGNLKIHNVFINPLGYNHILLLLEDTFPTSESSKEELCNLLLQKTQGNPFFLRELLKSLYEEEELRFLHTEGKWIWDTKRIAETSITDNVVELMSSRLLKLSPSARTALKYASCIGNEFPLQTLSIISKIPIHSLAEALMEAIQSGLLLSQNNDHKFLLLGEEYGLDETIRYKFIHDRIQEAGYQMVSEDEKVEIHHQIGRYYVSSYSDKELEFHVFDVVGHLNKAITLFLKEEERIYLSKLNLLAGKRAKRSTAYELSYNYLKIALEILGENSWELYYKQTYEIYIEILEASYLIGQFLQMKTLLETAKLKVREPLEKVNVMILEMNAQMAQGNLKEAIKISIISFKLLGFNYPENPSIISIFKNYAMVRVRYFTIKNKLYNINLISDVNILSILNIINIIGSTTAITNPKFTFYLALKAILFYFNLGSSKYTGMTMAGYSFVSVSYLDDIKTAKYFGELAEKLQGEDNLKCRTMYILNVAKHWYLPIDDYVESLIQNYHDSLEYGDIEYASHSLSQYISIEFIKGKNIYELQKNVMSLYDGFLRLTQNPSIRWVNSYLQILKILSESQNSTVSLDGEYFLEKDLRIIYLETSDNSGLFNLLLLKNILGVIFRINDELFTNTEEMEKLFSTFGKSIISSYYVFLDSYVLLEFLIEDKIPKTYISRVKKNQNKLREWSKYAPFNRLHHFLFIEGKIAEFEKNVSKSLETYEAAIEKAHENGFTMDEAIFCEHVGRYCSTLGKKERGEFYLNKSWKAYHQWGASLKVKLLEAEFPYLRKTTNPFLTIAANVTTVVDISRDKQSNLDLKTFMRFAQTISGEIEKEKLLSKIMNLLLQNAGATYACIFLEENSELYLESKMRSGEEVVTKHVRLEDFSGEVAISVIRYVFNRKEVVHLNNAFREGNFLLDSYIQNNQILSILCVPLINQGKRIGVLYLENNLVKGAFTNDRIEVLKVISSQAAISLENAKLYDNLEEKVAERTLELQAQKKELESQKKSIEQLSNFIKLLNESIDFNEILEKIGNYIKINYNMEHLALGMVDESGKFAKFINFTKLGSEVINQKILNIKVPVVGVMGAHAFTFATCKPLYSRVINKNRMTPEEIEIFEIYNFKSFLVLPLVLHGKNIGFLDIGNVDKSYILSKEQITQLSILSEHLAGTLYRTRLNSELQTQKLQLEKSLIQSDRMITLGTMVAGIAHEINTPLGAIKANGENIMESMSSLEDSINPLKTGITIETLQNVSYIFSISREPNTILSSKEQRTLRKKLVAYLEEHKYQNIDSLADKLIELGLVEALESGDTIFSSPGIGEALYLASLIRGIIKKAGVVQISAERVSKIVKSLKSFMHFEQTEEKKPADISEGMETVLVILHNKIKYGIEVIKNYGSLPQIPCYADELNQIWTNLIHNAIQAMGEKGILQIDIEKVPGLSAVPDIDKRNPEYKGEYISVSIQDSGSGISPEIRQKIFQAFFTTKPAGEGSGLGLHIIGKILEKHEGALYLESEPGRTRFSVLLPIG